jgi:hypothetical protein
MSKFIKLKKEYKDFIKENAIQIKKINIDTDLTKDKCQLIYKLYNKIYKIIEESDKLNVNDINHIILNYSKEDEDVELFKKFIKIKNLYLIKLIIRSDQWNNYILKLIGDLNLDRSNNKIEYIVSKGVYRLLMESVGQFRGCWEIADFTNNKLKKIEIIEPEHFEFIKKYLNNKL